ncbi:MAG: ABC transporter permease [Archaeoglobaceae archaeon]
MRVLIIAKKEFADHITSRRFLAFLVVFLLIFSFSVYQGVSSFMKTYELYASGASEKPNVIQIFGFLATGSTSILGGILGILMGFDLLTREKESGTLKTLLSHPVFRDEIINGKALGALLAMALVVFLTLIAAFGVLIALGFVPSVGDFVVILKFGAITLVYFFTFFSIGLFASAVAKSTTTALMTAFAVFIFLAIILPVVGFIATEALAGEPPKPPEVESYNIPGGSIPTEDPRWEEYERQMEEYMKRRLAISSVFTLLSPMSNYVSLASSLSAPESVFYPAGDTTKNWVSLIVTPAVFFAVSYVRFLREEIV